MKQISREQEPQSLFELCWTYAQGSMFALDCSDWKIITANPAAEVLSGYTREELIGMSLFTLHPEIEHTNVEAEIQKATSVPLHLPTGFHLQNKDGLCIPVMISSSKAILLDGHTVVNFVYFDITERMQREHLLAAQSWATNAFAIASLALGKANSTEELLLQAICEAITHKSVYVLAYIGIAEDGPGKPVRLVASAGSAIGYMEGLHLSWSSKEEFGQGPTGLCIRTNKIQAMQDAENDSAYLPWRARAKQFGIRSNISIPISVDGGWRGAIVVYSAQPCSFEKAAIEVFELLANQIVRGIYALNQERRLMLEQENLLKAERQLTEALSAMVAPIVTAMELRDPYTAGHQMRVAELACAMGRELEWSETQIQGLKIAAMVHDIGKISISAELLTKPNRLTHAELEIIHEHAETGYTILKGIPFSWPIAEIVRQHHEKLDGSGYPYGLKAEAILIEAKILSVADIVEAMSAFRPYRPAFELETVLQEIEGLAVAGKLDAEAVRVCVKLFREKGYTLPRLVFH